MRWLVGMILSQLQEIAEDRGAWLATVYGVAELDMTWQSNNNQVEICKKINLIFNIINKSLKQKKILKVHKMENISEKQICTVTKEPNRWKI